MRTLGLVLEGILLLLLRGHTYHGVRASFGSVRAQVAGQCACARFVVRAGSGGAATATTTATTATTATIWTYLSTALVGSHSLTFAIVVHHLMQTYTCQLKQHLSS